MVTCYRRRAIISFEQCTHWSDFFSKTRLSTIYVHVQVQMDVCNHTTQLNMTEKVLTVCKTFNDIHLGQNTVVGRRFFRPKYMTKSRNFPALESMIKQVICPRNVQGHFRQKIRPKCFDETGPTYVSLR